MFQNMGPSPSGRSGHAMASMGTRVFVLGGESFTPSKTDDPSIIHVLDTSSYSTATSSIINILRPHRAYKISGVETATSNHRLNDRCSKVHGNATANTATANWVATVKSTNKWAVDVTQRGPGRTSSSYVAIKRTTS